MNPASTYSIFLRKVGALGRPGVLPFLQRWRSVCLTASHRPYSRKKVPGMACPPKLAIFYIGLKIRHTDPPETLGWKRKPWLIS